MTLILTFRFSSPLKPYLDHIDIDHSYVFPRWLSRNSHKARAQKIYKKLEKNQ